MKFNLSLYDDTFFSWHTVHGDYYGVATGSSVMEAYKPQSVADFGCGIGSYLWAAIQAGCPVVKGWEIADSPARKYTRPEVQANVTYGFDITSPMTFEHKFDLVWCAEVAEHIEPTGSEQLVANLVAATGKLLIFTAAPAEQDGCGHINTHPLNYWRDLFAKHNFSESSEADRVKALLNPPPPAIHSPEWVMKNLLVLAPNS